jgi:hypothetical protein
LIEAELKALLALPRITKTLRRVASNRLVWIERTRHIQKVQAEINRIRRLSNAALWDEVTAAPDGMTQLHAMDEWRRREKLTAKFVLREAEKRRNEEIKSAQQQVEHLTTEQLLAYSPTKETREIEIRGVIKELRRRVKLCERKIRGLDRMSWHAPNHPMRTVTNGVGNFMVPTK